MYTYQTATFVPGFGLPKSQPVSFPNINTVYNKIASTYLVILSYNTVSISFSALTKAL